MYKYLVFTVFLAILLSSPAAFGQTNTTRRASQNEAILAANDSAASRSSSNKPEAQAISRQASEDAKRLYKMGVRYGLAGLFRQAAELFQKAVQLNPNYADAYYGLGHAYFDLGRWEEAIQSLEQAVKIDPQDREAHAMLDQAHLRSGRETKLFSQPGKHSAAGVPVSLNVPAEPRSDNSAASPPAKSDLTRDYRVGVGDVLDIRLSDAPVTQSTLFTVTPPGLLEHPILAEPLRVSGLTVDEIKVRLEADLKRRAVSENPRVTVGVREYLSHAIIVSGLVKEPGTKLLRLEAIPLYVVIADAQPAAEAALVTIVKHETGETLSVDLSDPTQMNLLVRPGDVITVHSNPEQFFYVGGEVKNPGEKSFRAGLTLTQAILMAGGLTRKSNEADLARDGGNGFLSLTRYKLKDINSGKLADPRIKPGDRITIH